ncbi:hypothetical protein E0W68_11840 [Flavobacterium salilacus subsp. salilacus]|uniref:hypothetical protein n=1 Tax=Flavobacterium TaxID=237 RepID=UPI0010756076|nr:MULTISPECIES: hypothetical protein [Flavobacterium]KAF2516900.1 hypothetical protein E0W68_11840 [Flavobacterium salilacus subsp. salilacus]MBE1615740.1 hypothetical protein [Flavobacterium sp. SaA2.13]
MQLSEKHISKILLIAIVLVTLAKLSLIGEGFMTFPDEARYMPSGKVLENLAHFDIKEAAANLNKTQGRPGETLIKTIPSALQYASAELFSMETYESANSYPLFLFNFTVYCLILLQLYNIAKLLLKDKVLALFSVLLYCCLINGYIYIRHTLPYDCSLLVMSYVLLQVLKTTKNNTFSTKKMLLLGSIAFFGYVVYPGYVLLFGLVFIILITNKLTKSNLLQRIKYGMFYTAGSIICLLLFELIARIGDTSYIQDSITLSKTITQGNFEEGFSFLFKYLYNVESVNGIIISIGLLLFVGILIYNVFIGRKVTDIHLLFIVTAILFLLYASNGYFFHKMIWYGRLLHQFFFVLTIITAYAFGYISQNISYKKIVPSSISGIAIVTFIINLIEYKSYAYPKDIVWEIEKTTSYNNLKEACEHSDGWSVMDYIHSKHQPVTTADTIVLVNGCYFYPLEDIESYNPYITNKNEKLILAKPYFINFKAYQYEGYTIKARQNIDSLQLKIKVYTTK